MQSRCLTVDLNICNGDLRRGSIPKPCGPTGAVSASQKAVEIRFSGTRSWGRFGPATLGTMRDRSTSITSLYSGTGSPGVDQARLHGRRPHHRYVILIAAVAVR